MGINDKRIDQLKENPNPLVNTDLFAMYSSEGTVQQSLDKVTDYLSTIISTPYVTGGTYTAGVATFSNTYGDTFEVTGFYDGTTTPSELVFFSTNNPNDVGTVFNPDTPQTTDTLYISSGNSSNWTWDGSVYNTYSASTVSSTPWKLYGTSIDAGGNKTAFIKREGPILVQATNDRYAGYFYNRATSGLGRGLIVKKDLRTTSGDYLTVQGQNFSNGTLQNRLIVTHDGFLEINGAYTLPNVDGNDKDIMYTDGAGNVSWTGITSLLPPVVPTTTYWTSGSTGNFSIKTINDSTTDATGLYAVASGFNTLASGDYSYAEGLGTEASGNYSHAEGLGTEASGNYSHAEGLGSLATGLNSHAEGYNTRATDNYSHSEGVSTIASGHHSHAEGSNTIASGHTSHAEGALTRASGSASHAEGQSTIASGNRSHSEGQDTRASGHYSHAEGFGSHAIGNYSHAEGSDTIAIGQYSHAGGLNSTASASASFIHSFNSLVTGTRSVVLGGQNITGTTADTVYVPKFNIGILPTGTSITNLGITSDGMVVSGSSSLWIETGDSDTAIKSNKGNPSIIGISTNSIIALGLNNTMESSVGSAIIVGSTHEMTDTNTSVILGGVSGDIIGRSGSKIDSATLIGGSGNKIVDTSSDSDRASIIGGVNNTINNSIGGVIVGSSLSNIINTSEASFILGGASNLLDDVTWGGIIGGFSHKLTGNRSVVLGGQNITGSTDDTVYVPKFNIGTLPTGTTVNNLGIDSNGYVIIGDTGANSGVFGIADSSGVYTYYATFTLAMAVAVPGQTVEMFADVLETGSVSVVMKTGVNINGNGHTYTLNVNDATHAINSTFQTLEMFNLKVVRTGRANNATGYAINSFSANLKGSGVYFVNTYGIAVNGGFVLHGIHAIAYGDAINHGGQGNLIYNCVGESTAGIGIFNLYSSTYNSLGKSVSGIGILSNGETYMCTGISTSSAGIAGQRVTSSTGISTSGVGIEASIEGRNCTAISVSGSGGYGKFYSSYLRSTSGSANSSSGGQIYNCYAESSGAAVAPDCHIYNSTVVSKWNNAGGYLVRTTISYSREVLNSTLIVANASANCIFTTASTTCNYANNVFKVATTPVNALIIQGITNTADSQGNILV